MAAGSTVLRFEIELSDSDRSVYETLDLRVAQHPSESVPFLLVRLLAYCLEYEPGIEFSKGGVSSTSEPAVSILAPTGDRLVWIDVGAPSAERLHRASKATERVALYTDRRLDLLRTSVGSATIHRANDILVTPFPADFLRALGETLERRNRWSVSKSDGHLYVSSGERDLELEIGSTPLREA